jgi:hypothetical protein
MRLGNLIEFGILPRPEWVKNSFGLVAPELGVMCWKSGRSDPLANALKRARELSGKSILYAVPASAKNNPTAGRLTAIVQADALGDRVENLISADEMPDRSKYPSAVRLRHYFKFREPLPVMREIWPDSLRRKIMQQGSFPRPLPAEAVEPLLDLDLIECPIGLQFRFRVGQEDPGRDKVGATAELLKQTPKAVREGYRTDPILISRVHRAAWLTINVKQAQRNTDGELHCEACSRGSRLFVRHFGPRVERAWHAHHCEPVSLRERESTLSDFVILCAFCHAIAHSKAIDQVWSVDELKAQFGLAGIK